MDLSYEDVQAILKIIDSSSLEELHLEIGDFKLVVRKRSTGAPAEVSSASPAADGGGPRPASTPAPAAAAAQPAPPGRAPGPSRPLRDGDFAIKAPMVGTFYRAPAPGAPPFVETGQTVTEDSTICIIEVMKLMNTIKAGRRGRVAEICADNGALVEYGQTLIVIEPLA